VAGRTSGTVVKEAGVTKTPGIETRSSVAEIRAAVRNEGIVLVVRRRGSRWQALARTIPGSSALHVDAWAASPGEAARRAWQRHVEEHGMTGAR
jgi:hypothetical protein